jgi:hypothetical protein
MIFGAVALGVLAWAANSGAKPKDSPAMKLELAKEWAGTDPAAGGNFLWGEYVNNQRVSIPTEGAPPIYYINKNDFTVFDVTSEGYLFRSASLTKSLQEYLG